MATPTLRIDTSYLDISGAEAQSRGPVNPLSPGRSRARSLSQTVLPSFRLSASPGNAEKSSIDDISQNTIFHGANKARSESRKLLAHILQELRDRPKPPSSLAASKTGTRADKGLGAVIQSVKGAVKHQRTRSQAKVYTNVAQDENDSDLEEDIEFNTDVTFGLMCQLRDVLYISALQKWDILNDGYVRDPCFYAQLTESYPSPTSTQYGREKSNSLRQRRSSQSNRRQSRAHDSQLLSQCIKVLSSIVTEDCRFRTSSPRPSRPPYALQAVTLDVTQFLIDSHRESPLIVSQVVFAIIPAFYTFDVATHARLLAFFEDGVLGGIMDDLKRIQGTQRPEQTSVDEAEDATPSTSVASGWRRWSTGDPLDGHGILATRAPAQDIALYQLSSFVSPLLAAILENVDLVPDRPDVLHRFHRLLSRCIEAKPDLYLDILAVIAYHTPKARIAGISILTSYWPRAIGHTIVSKAFPDITYSAPLLRTSHPSQGRKPQQLHTHQFVPWRFGLHAASASIWEGLSQDVCNSCSKMITGFGLLCTFCMCAVHFDCYDYPEGSSSVQYFVASEEDRQKIAVYRFCHILPARHQSQPQTVNRDQHTFRYVNLFSLTICLICRNPLWGCWMQGLRCSSCRQFVHGSCLTSMSSSLARCRSVSIDDSFVAIEWSQLRASCLDHYRSVLLTESDIARKTYEEVSAYSSMLWLQLQILLHGVALGSIVVIGQIDASPDESDLQEFELHAFARRFEECLASNRLPISTALAEYLGDNNLRADNVQIFFNLQVLVFITSTIKLPVTSNLEMPTSSGLLAANTLEEFADTDSDEAIYPFEVLSLARLRDQLGDHFQFFSEETALHALQCIHQLGFIQRLDLKSDILDDITMPDSTLVSAIEACLADISLSTHEAGLLLLVRRFWPDGMLTPYALGRLCTAVVSWILSEDHNLVVMLRDFVAKGQSLPGVRSGSDLQLWPPQILARSALASVANNGGDYIATRRTLLKRYAARWLLAFHDSDPYQYAAVLFTTLLALAEEGPVSDEYFLGKETDQRRMDRQTMATDKLLRLIIKLDQVAVLFTSFEDLFKRWLEYAQDLSVERQPLSAMSRLFNREGETNQRSTVIMDNRMTMTEASGIATANALNILIDTAKGGVEGFRQMSHWLCLFVRSGVDISVQTFGQVMGLARRFNATLEECLLLIKAITWSAWMRSVGRQELQTVVASFHHNLVAIIVDNLQQKRDLELISTFIRLSLAGCLLVYGCERKHVLDLALIHKEEIDGLPSRRKLHSRTTTMADPVIVNAELMQALTKYVETGNDEISCFIAKFLNAFVNDVPFVESYEIDNFILRNGNSLATCMWQFYGIRSPEISSIRPALLLRILVVDGYPFQTLLDSWCGDHSWELRLQAALRLFSIVLDVTSPVFHVEGRQWKTSIVAIFDRFFSCLWMDEREEVRLAVDTWSHTLLEAHQTAIASCWNEALAKAPIADRVKLVSFLNQIQPHFPKWPVLAWDVITDTLHENDEDHVDPAAAHLVMSEDYTKTTDPELASLKVSMISLSLRMIAEGIPIDPIQSLKVKEHLVRALGFQEVVLVPTASGRLYHIQYQGLYTISQISEVCLNDLMLVLDCAEPYDIAPAVMGGPYAEDETPDPLLIGSIFVDVPLELFVHTRDMMSLTFIALKNLLKTLIIILYKHDFDSRSLQYLQGTLRRAVRRSLEVLTADVSYELRQLALSACHIFIKRWPMLIGNFVIEAIETAVQLLISLDYEHNGGDVLVDQLKTFLTTTLSTFASGGIFNVVCKRPLSSDFFTVIRLVTAPISKPGYAPAARESLRDTILRDTLSRSLDNDPDTFQLVIENMQTYIKNVHNSGFSTDLMQAVGLWLTSVARRTAEWPPDLFNPSPLFLLACTLVENNKAQSRDLLGYTETLLRAALNCCNVSTESLVRLIQVTSLLYRRAAAAKPVGSDALPSNPIVHAMLEVIAESVRLKARTTPATLTSLFEAMTATAVGELFQGYNANHGVAFNLASDALLFLYNDSAPGSLIQSSFDVSQAAATLVVEVANHLPAVLARLKVCLHATIGLSLHDVCTTATTSDAPPLEHARPRCSSQWAQSFCRCGLRILLYLQLGVLPRTGRIPATAATARPARLRAH
ncbi:hypothetical protein IEO21_04673 [Rhodonia placenta]|uniref:Phorbol-ester/DAG-type domain-containing protein n=1 Tax=Rhodonia placenta TaxID=104341 RepID=A0A8H7P3G1_9APHY|nr:hypothetical protein IEO21_04673 [Postia placenta]